MRKRASRFSATTATELNMASSRKFTKAPSFLWITAALTAIPDLDDSEKTKQMTIAKVCEIMAWQDQNLGILNENGFSVPLKLNENFVGECITLTEANLVDDDVIEDKYALDE